MTLKEKYNGVVVPMVSPVKDDFTIDADAVKQIIASFLKNDIIPFVLGTTGEAASLSSNQKEDLIRLSYSALGGKQNLVAGIGSNSLFTAIEEGKKYADMGANALVATVPNYYPSDESQIISWFEKLADQVPVPLFMYNIPVTTHHSISLKVAEKLSYHPNIIGIKDSERDIKRLDNSLSLWKDREDFMVLVGWAAMSVHGLLNGANGIVPSVGNLIPNMFRQLFVAAISGHQKEAMELQAATDQIADLCQKGRNISQSIPAMKVLMAMKSICGTQVLPPLLKMDEGNEEDYRVAMKGMLEKLTMTK